ncbi:MAG: hypothetical protein QNK37_17585 [Acidobacteriota bacterium]|nr:hypothetical protein [Acidobacteriota bacterium]
MINTLLAFFAFQTPVVSLPVFPPQEGSLLTDKFTAEYFVPLNDGSFLYKGPKSIYKIPYDGRNAMHLVNVKTAILEKKDIEKSPEKIQDINIASIADAGNYIFVHAQIKHKSGAYSQSFLFTFEGKLHSLLVYPKPGERRNDSVRISQLTNVDGRLFLNRYKKGVTKGRFNMLEEIEWRPLRR